MLILKRTNGIEFHKIGIFDSQIDIETKGCFGQLIDCANDLLENDAREVSFEFRKNNIIRIKTKNKAER